MRLLPSRNPQTGWDPETLTYPHSAQPPTKINIQEYGSVFFEGILVAVGFKGAKQQFAHTQTC